MLILVILSKTLAKPGLDLMVVLQDLSNQGSITRAFADRE
jgi:hypothetical protein